MTLPEPILSGFCYLGTWDILSIRKFHLTYDPFIHLNPRPNSTSSTTFRSLRPLSIKHLWSYYPLRDPPVERSLRVTPFRPKVHLVTRPFVSESLYFVTSFPPSISLGSKSGYPGLSVTGSRRTLSPSSSPFYS